MFKKARKYNDTIKAALNFIFTRDFSKSRNLTCLLYHDLDSLDSEQVFQEIEADNISPVEILKCYKKLMPNVLISYKYSGGDEIETSLNKGEEPYYISRMAPIVSTDEFCKKECTIKICEDKEEELPYIAKYKIPGIVPEYADIARIVGEKINSINKRVAMLSKLEEPNSFRYVKVYTEEQATFLHNSLVEKKLLDANLSLFLYYWQVSDKLPDGDIHLKWNSTNALLAYLIAKVFSKHYLEQFPNKETNFIFGKKGLKSSLNQSRNVNEKATPRGAEIVNDIVEKMCKMPIK